MRLVFSDEAKQNIASIDDYYRPKNPAAANRILDDIEHTSFALTSFPFKGRLLAHANVRRTITKRYGFIVFYRLMHAKDTIEIIAIQHGREQRLFEDR